jgi:uncharacterized protein
VDLTIDDVRALYIDADSVHDFDHILRVLALARRIARAEGANWPIVRTATLLHDWGRADAQQREHDHAAVAAAQTRRFLISRGEPEGYVEAVTHAIAAHRFRTVPNPETLEAKVLFDADKLDAIGAIGIARAFAYGGAHNQRLWASRDDIDVAQWEQAGDDPNDHTPVHEFVVKLSRIRDRLQTTEGRLIAQQRHQYMVAYFERLDMEVAGQF